MKSSKGEPSSRVLKDLPPDDDPSEHFGEAPDVFQQDLMSGGHWIAFSRITKETATAIITELHESQNFFLVIASASSFNIPYYDEMATYFGSFINKLCSVCLGQLFNFLNESHTRSPVPG